MGLIRSRRRTAAWDTLVGRELPNGYQLKRLIAQSARSAVFEGLRSYQADDHRVAIKVLNAGDAAFCSRFEREISATRALAHPSTIRVFDVGRDGRHLYLTMELVDGPSLLQLLEQDGALRPRRAIAIGLQVLDSLAEAHEQGLVHGRIKPSNILLRDAGTESEVVKVADYGLSWIAGRPTGKRKTTAAVYMSPEQLGGAPLGAASDIFSLGAVIYRAITGRPPYRGTDDNTLAIDMQKGPPPLLSPHGARVPAELQDTVRNALRAPLDSRLGSAAEFRSHLESCIALFDEENRQNARQTNGISPTQSGTHKVAWLSGATTPPQVRRSTAEHRPGSGLGVPIIAPAKPKSRLTGLLIATIVALGLGLGAYLYLQAPTSDKQSAAVGPPASQSGDRSQRKPAAAAPVGTSNPGQATTSGSTITVTAPTSAPASPATAVVTSPPESQVAQSRAKKPAPRKRRARIRRVRRRVRRQPVKPARAIASPASASPPARPAAAAATSTTPKEQGSVGGAEPGNESAAQVQQQPSPALQPKRPPQSPAGLRDIESNPYLP